MHIHKLIKHLTEMGFDSLLPCQHGELVVMVYQTSSHLYCVHINDDALNLVSYTSPYRLQIHTNLTFDLSQSTPAEAVSLRYDAIDDHVYEQLLETIDKVVESNIDSEIQFDATIIHEDAEIMASRYV